MRTRAHVCVLAVFVAAACVGGQASAQAPDRGTGSHTVPRARVIEADTLEVWIGGTRIGVGVIGIKAPQGNTACGREAIRVAQEMVNGGIWLDEDLAVPSIDDRKRRLYRVSISTGRPLAVELAQAGLSAADASAASASDSADITAAEMQARNEGRGCLWARESLPAR